MDAPDVPQQQLTTGRLLTRLFVKLLYGFGAIAFVYPWMYSVLDSIQCAPHGTLDPWVMECICPLRRSGPRCDTCNIPRDRGTCKGGTSVCNGLRKGVLCEICMGVQAENTCSDTCDNNRGYYNYRQTCRYCSRNDTCSGHGRCLDDGLCQCDEGWAGEIDGSRPCSLPCQADSGGKPCSGHGVCVAGGQCQCTSPYCGQICDIPLVHEEDIDTPNIAWCYGNGVPDISVGGTCSCGCKRDQYGMPMTVQSEGKTNNYCKHLCPLGTGSHVCGASAIGVALISFNGTERCGCQCSATNAPRPKACDTDCAYGGIKNIDGDCLCTFPNQVGQYPYLCRTCKPGYFMPELGCQAHCVDGVTCITGYCDVDTQNPFRMTCKGCGAHRSGEIIAVVMRSNSLIAVTDRDSAFSNVTYQYFLGNDETRKADVVPIGQSFLRGRYFEYEENKVVVYLNSTDSATITIDAKDGSLGESPYTLDPPMVFEERGLLYGKPFEVSAGSGVDIATLCVSSAPLCQAYSEDPPVMYKALSTNNANGEMIDSDSVFVVATFASFVPESVYNLTIIDTVQRGCATCTENYYPEPTSISLGGDSCSTYCTNGTCHFNGYCSDQGTCVCNFPNMDATCSKCQPNWFPDPGIGVEAPCSQACFGNKMPDDRGSDGVPDDANTCSNHGVCNATGQCRCSDTSNGPLNGFSGESCQYACNPEHESDTVCSGHGVCIRGQCVQCNDGYFGTQCEVTCNRPDQFFWKEKLEGEIVPSNAETNVPCTRNDQRLLCTKLPCNGGSCQKTNQYVHLGKTISYTLCSVGVGSKLVRRPLMECTGFDEATYPYNTSEAKMRIASELGIYCDVDKSEGASEFSSRIGLCARAECSCTKTATRISRNGNTIALPIGTRLGGPACQNSGCPLTEFGNIARWTSACGERPPPIVASPLAVLYRYPEDLARGYDDLQALLSNAPQMCSRGTCLTVENNVANGTEHGAAPADAEGVEGYCECKQTPESEKAVAVTQRGLDGTLSQKNVQCSVQGEPQWARACCKMHEEGGKSPFFGQGCSDRCLCNSAQYWKGTCAIGAGEGTSMLGVGCNCRAGYHEDMRASPRTRLFCGPTCDYTCKGVINRITQQPVPDLRKACPADKAQPSVPAQQSGCYDDLLPCNGHGACTGRNGMCLQSNLKYGGRESSCVCWGTQISLSDVPENYELPNLVALYGGEDCSHPCPGAERLDAFVQEHYDVLHGTSGESADAVIETKRSFINLYKQHVCSGHGFCSVGATSKNARLVCECPGDFGGDQCDKQCTLDDTYWQGRRPYQELNANPSIDNLLSTDFGLNACGPRGRCVDNNECSINPMYANGRFVGMDYDTARAYVKSLLSADVDDNLFTNFFEQWSMAFVGAFAVCTESYYSATPLSRNSQDSSYIHQIPDIVGWQLTRSCDAQYRQFTEYPNEQNAPWCCQEPVNTAKWKDEHFVDIGTHGGCPVNKCPNFATGRQCTTCRSPAFAHLLSATHSASCNELDGLNQMQGYCAVCAQQKYQNKVYPYDAYNLKHYGEKELECEQCLSDSHRLSGEQKYKQQAELNLSICNGHGKCMGRTKTFGGKLYGMSPADFVVDKDADLLLCGDTPQLGLCECDEDFEGPTCAMPKTQAACGAHGTLKNFPTKYSYCDCERGYIGMYCDMYDNTGVSSQSTFVSMCQVAQRLPSGAVQLIDCNDATGNTKCSSGRCSTCSHPLLDPDAMCREYKDIVLTTKQENVRKKRRQSSCI